MSKQFIIMQNSIERRKLAMKRNTKSERNVKTLGAVTHTHTHTGNY